MAQVSLGRQDALLIVDFQKDFLPGGPLSATDCDRVPAVLNEWISLAERSRSTIVASRDWHPPEHVSFQSRGGPWPKHCVQGTKGAEFADELHLPATATVVSKGMSLDSDQYSAFEGTGLAEMLKDEGIQRIWVGGLVREVCVRSTVLDALKEGFEVYVIVEGTAPVERENGFKALQEMESAGARLEQG